MDFILQHALVRFSLMSCTGSTVWFQLKFYSQYLVKRYMLL
uniref:Uncharacterized protein n=1 Tax=Rhizophora mucronata TaxID=61149 RepID=A0A2P2L6L5_RHIMU